MRYLLHDVFINSYKNKPKNIAILKENGESLTYEDLNSLSNKFSSTLKFVKSNNLITYPYVGVISSVHEKSIGAVLGALKIGCSYVPLDEYSPVERLTLIINNTELDTIVVDEYLYERFTELYSNTKLKNIIILGNELNLKYDNEKVIPYSQVLEQDDNEPEIKNQVSDDLAYILHSSGSTGIPKGIMLTHRNARTFVDWMQKEFDLNESDVVMSRAPFKFDLSVFDIFNTFNSSATLVCFDWNKKREEENKHRDYVKLISRSKATILYTTPSTFIALMNRGGLSSEDIHLREVMYAGEPFPVPQLKMLMNILPYTKIANIYGPTETNIITYYWIDKIEDEAKSIPLGYVVDDTEIIVVSEDCSKLCEPNELGELWCRGGTVTLGYLGLDQKTKENLVLSPFHKYPVKFWRTGDFGFRDKEGMLHYRGRRDHMVKVKGFRIEIGEIETAIAKVKGIDEFVVVAKPDEKYGNRLYCFFSVLNNEDITENDMKGFLLSKLPEYMIPFKFIKMTSLPKTSSGKVDRVLLVESIN